MKHLVYILLFVSLLANGQAKQLGLPEHTTPENRIAFTMYTVSKNTVKMLAQFHPIKNYDPVVATLQVKEGDEWVDKDTAEIIYPGYTCHFRIDNWDDSKAQAYKVCYNNKAFYEGIIQKNPIDKADFVMGVFSCNSVYDEHGGTVSRQDIVDNMLKIKPDLLFFAGDQVYDHSEHYWHWLRFGQDFGELFRNTPAIAIPDDHDVGQANLWGEGGKKGISRDGWNGGYVMPVEYVKEVERAQTGHLPDPYDPTPIQQGIGVYYTSLTWGGMSFAILEDRKFKTGPAILDHRKVKNPLELDVPEAELLGQRQIDFLEHWTTDWTGAEMKAILSATIFISAGTESGTKENKMERDFDTNGWPQTGRNIALETIRKSYSCMIAGDQHLGSVIHHGIKDWGDAGYSFATPAIASLWMRWWEPQTPGKNPIAGLPYTGEFTDGFSNKFTMLAVANPILSKNVPSEDLVNARGAGIGIVRFNKKSRQTTFECWARNVDVTNPNNKPFPGWPITINQLDNFSMKNGYQLPLLKISKANQVVTIRDGYTREVNSSIRVKGSSFQPRVTNPGDYDIVIGEGENIQTIYRVKAQKVNKEKLTITL